MATSATMSTATIPATVSFSSSKVQNRKSKVVFMNGLNSYGGLKAQNTIASLGLPVATEQCFANFVNTLRSINKSGGAGGALTSKCNAAAEIFRIAAIMNGLTLVGVAVGFVLLRIEASVEESE
ncbi:uncharacterized protein LOC141586755 [Silene latifolia]|uniref:uncharacterized protein LOC141586755 n=1 Tax=Silene latifolia TaxID=37657 RepID=UPI003D78872D